MITRQSDIKTRDDQNEFEQFHDVHFEEFRKLCKEIEEISPLLEDGNKRYRECNVCLHDFSDEHGCWDTCQELRAVKAMILQQRSNDE